MRPGMIIALLLFSGLLQAQTLFNFSETRVHRYEQPAPYDRLITWKHMLEVEYFFMKGDTVVKDTVEMPFLSDGRSTVLDQLNGILTLNWPDNIENGLYIFSLECGQNGQIGTVQTVLADNQRSAAILLSMLQAEAPNMPVNRLNGRLTELRIKLLRERRMLRITRLNGDPVPKEER